MTQPLFPDLTPHHVGLSVGDLEESIAFWSDIFGFELEFRKHLEPIKTHLAFLRRGDFRIELFEKEGANPSPAERLKPNTDLGTHGTKHLCFSVADPQATLETLFHKGVPIVGVMRSLQKPMQFEDDPRLTDDDEREPANAFFVLAPSGILVEILAASSFAK
jgi:catechol 2,3-dioxygenase-like lactoylglutathione lyase family enzyme